MLVVEACGCWSSFEKDWKRLGHPVLIAYSSQEWSRVCVDEVARDMGFGSIFWDVSGVRNHICVNVCRIGWGA